MGILEGWDSASLLTESGSAFSQDPQVAQAHIQV